MRHRDMCAGARCVVVGGAPISCYERARGFIKNDDFVIYCDSGLKHLEGLGAAPSLIIGDWDSYDDPHMDVETITLPCEKDDTDTYFAVKEAIKRGYEEFLLIGVVGNRFDHTMGNISILLYLDSYGKNGVIIDDYSEMEIVSSNPVYVEEGYSYFSLLNMTDIPGSSSLATATELSNINIAKNGRMMLIAKATLFLVPASPLFMALIIAA